MGSAYNLTKVDLHNEAGDFVGIGYVVKELAGKRLVYQPRDAPTESQPPNATSPAANVAAVTNKESGT